MVIADAAFWVALMKIIGVNVVLSGDNAIVIALAARALPANQQKQAVMLGSGAAVIMRIVLTIAAVELLRLPYLKLVGSVLLLWIALKLLVPEHEEGGEGEATGSLASAIKTILIADLVMSLDNVIAVAAAAQGNLTLLIAGLAISIPLVIFGSTLLLKLMERWPIIIVIGAGLLGWVAGEMAVTDPLVAGAVDERAHWLHWAAPAVGAAFVVITGKWLAARALRKAPASVDLAIAPVGGVAHVAAPAVAGAAGIQPGLFERVLLPVDASDTAARAVEYLINLRRHLSAPESLDVHVLNVQRPLPGDVASFVPKKSLQDYHREKGTEAIDRARRLLDAAGVRHTPHMLVGVPWDAISEYAASHACDHIVMGTRGLGTYTGAPLGSVAAGVAQRSTVPVLLVK